MPASPTESAADTIGSIGLSAAEPSATPQAAGISGTTATTGDVVRGRAFADVEQEVVTVAERGVERGVHLVGSDHRRRAHEGDAHLVGLDLSGTLTRLANPGAGDGIPVGCSPKVHPVRGFTA